MGWRQRIATVMVVATTAAASAERVKNICHARVCVSLWLRCGNFFTYSVAKLSRICIDRTFNMAKIKEINILRWRNVMWWRLSEKETHNTVVCVSILHSFGILFKNAEHVPLVDTHFPCVSPVLPTVFAKMNSHALDECNACAYALAYNLVYFHRVKYSIPSV